ncbi:MAG TPA: 4-alpha-glucanotransferase [Thermodesulfobacteriota bacterium]|nr:4-alpha-glucanotransferase [Thermodesulfobacteriota bacterium]
MKRRGSGILLHITSLPSNFGIGDLGPSSCRFADFLSESKQSFWQILPLNPTDLAFGSSPYSSPSAFAGNPLLISPESLVADGLLSSSDIEDAHLFSNERVDFTAVTNYKEALLQKAFNNFKKKGSSNEFEEFCVKNSYWLEDYALFAVLKPHFNGVAWSEWPIEIANRNETTLQELKNNLGDKVELEKFIQYIFFKQWFSLKSYCNNKKINIIGDIPIYVNHDSADVWSNPEIFKLDKKKWPKFVAGVPPDYFSKTGQRWGNPVYRWNIIRKNDYQWWIKRMDHNLKLFDMMRLDHFRGFVGYWEIPADEKTAINGKWRKAPAKDLFTTLVKRFNHLPIIAEDLGVITPDVIEVMNRFGFSGMKLLLFAFGDDFPNGSYLPHNYTKNCVVYTGTHDNNTVRGWWRSEASPEDRKRVFKYIGREVSEENIHWEFIRLAMMSIANICIIPMQDILGLGEEAKMNRPSKTEGNWQWRLKPDQITSSQKGKLKEIIETYGRWY